ncbi:MULTISPECIES: nicotinate-nucleotide adenylyltransferase [Snodgrassella]|uniref:nicotinate-nucleotide adenylyltransferase n=1 Tax=Snodgrassella TaxID=1193515 RepID=UPI0004D9170D|nr:MULTISPECIES: nicotinate-nucleotide adenylyltransferase [Snodgrassella]KES10867.1 Nicotinic acid mononucleotide adenylyltransferase [Snodgrassella alvi SCGC AB-598-O11]MBI0068231.1 nicotinate (nicotinamide) nucleotide adenylyltransferase [Snodgrassella sp. M0110]MBI0077127.1 nicotinate (nicotinamide) nucleotide adenylyltransferase [Snodgrassella sp. M0118]MBI0079532.1 nicotinate (nicotinamide) nucleotide adenylyltransferase [Snodgrassella sp. M0112]
MKRIGLFGGTFDPPHNGHIHIAQGFADELMLDNVIFIPAGDPYHKPTVICTPALQRLAMVERAISTDKRFSVSDCDVLRNGPTYTIDTVSLFRQVFPQSQLWWLLGMDSLLQLPHWHRYQALLQSVNLAIAQRGQQRLTDLPESLQQWLPDALAKNMTVPDGSDGGRAVLLQTSFLPVSSTDIRAKWSSGYHDDVPETVAEYIDHEGLYQA